MNKTPPFACLLHRSYEVAAVSFEVRVHGSAEYITSVQIGALPAGAAKLRKVAPRGLGRLFDRQLRDYLSDARNGFALPLYEHADSAAQRAAIEFLRTIKLGQTRSYSDQAQFVRGRCASGFGPRNAGQANHNNHYPLVVPCHRVVRKNGALGGFMGSTRHAALALKGALLAHERNAA